jgi:hypothetical protein
VCVCACVCARVCARVRVNVPVVAAAEVVAVSKTATNAVKGAMAASWVMVASVGGGGGGSGSGCDGAFVPLCVCVPW